MSAPQHTPGPWRVGRDILGDAPVACKRAASSCYDAVIQAERIAVAMVAGESETECLANAHLVAAAPELLAALRETIDSVAILATGRCPADLVQERIALLATARAAIAKATGGAS